MIYTSSCGRLTLSLSMAQARGASHQGACDDDVRALSQVPAIARQLRRLDPALLRGVLSEYGAWDTLKLADHEQNLQRILWIAAGDIAEGIC